MNSLKIAMKVEEHSEISQELFAKILDVWLASECTFVKVSKRF